MMKKQARIDVWEESREKLRTPEQANVVILAVNERLPRTPGSGECIQISQADYIAEGPNIPPPGRTHPSGGVAEGLENIQSEISEKGRSDCRKTEIKSITGHSF